MYIQCDMQTVYTRMARNKQTNKGIDFPEKNCGLKRIENSEMSRLQSAYSEYVRHVITYFF